MQVVEQLIGAEVLAFCMYMVTAEPCNPELPFQDPLAMEIKVVSFHHHQYEQHL